MAKKDKLPPTRMKFPANVSSFTPPDGDELKPDKSGECEVDAEDVEIARAHGLVPVVK